MTSGTCFAPATVANVAVGFDIMGFSFPSVGDKITLTRTEATEVVIDDIFSLGPLVPLKECKSLPRDAQKNCATAGLLQLLQDLKPGFGFSVKIGKGIPLGSGMGGSAASAVGAIVAANAFLAEPLPKETLLKYALLGEAVASGARHPDNVTPCLYGGLTLIRSTEPLDVVVIPVPSSLYCALVHPHAVVETRKARGILRPEISLGDFVRQSSNLAGFIAGCFHNDIELIRRSMVDILIEPQRAPLFPAFIAAKSRAMQEGALGCSFSGSGPSIFAWAESKPAAENVRKAIVEALSSEAVRSDSWVAPIKGEGARLL